MIEVGMGNGAVAVAPDVISCAGLGSCVALALYDSDRRIGGLAHVMLPDSNGFKWHPTPYMCADTALAALLEEMFSKGARLPDIVAKIAGGARMFVYDGESGTGIGQQNIAGVRRILNDEGIPVLGDDVGGHYGRSLEFHLDVGRIIVKAWSREDREL